MTAAALVGSLAEAFETDYPWCAEELKLFRGGRCFRLHVMVDMFLANRTPDAALAVAVTECQPDIGKALKGNPTSVPDSGELTCRLTTVHVCMELAFPIVRRYFGFLEIRTGER